MYKILKLNEELEFESYLSQAFDEYSDAVNFLEFKQGNYLIVKIVEMRSYFGKYCSILKY